MCADCSSEFICVVTRTAFCTQMQLLISDLKSILRTTHTRRHTKPNMQRVCVDPRRHALAHTCARTRRTHQLSDHDIMKLMQQPTVDSTLEGNVVLKFRFLFCNASQNQPLMYDLLHTTSPQPLTIVWVKSSTATHS